MTTFTTKRLNKTKFGVLAFFSLTYKNQFYIIYLLNNGENMKDPRISIRLTESEHEALKIVAARKHKKIQQIMLEYINELIKDEVQNGKN